MAAAKKSFIIEDLEFAEQQLASWKQYIINNPQDTLKDRVEWKQTKTGGMMPMVVATIEAQGKFLQETLKNYLALLETLDRLRSIEETKKEARGGKNVPASMMKRPTDL